MNKKFNTHINRGFATIDEYDNISKYEEEVASIAYKEYRRKWSNNPKNLVLEKGPLHIDIDPTNYCNLKCTMCTRTRLNSISNKKEKLQCMDFDLFKDIIDEAKVLDVPSIKFGILSEPLVHPKFVDMVQYVSNKGFVDIGLVTNATLLNEDKARKLIGAGLMKINISFDSPVKETYEAIRVGADYDKTLNNIKKLIKIRDDMNSLTPLLRIQCVKLKENSNERALFLELFKPIADRIAFIDYEEKDDTLADYSVLNNSEFDNYICSQLWQRLTVDSFGIAFPCCAGTAFKEISWDIRQYGIESIWQDKVQILRDSFINNTWKEIPMCRKCIARAWTANYDDGKV